jgi:hypothetical protein
VLPSASSDKQGPTINPEPIAQPIENIMDEDVFHVKKIVNCRLKLGEDTGNIPDTIGDLVRRCEFLVRWDDYGTDEDTWEPYENLLDAADCVKEFLVKREISINRCKCSVGDCKKCACKRGNRFCGEHCGCSRNCTNFA